LTDHPAHLSDPVPHDRRDRCGYAWSHGHTGCTEPAVTHFRVVQPSFTAVIASCAEHADETRTALPVSGEHPFMRTCARANHWHTGPTGSWCVR
jgi:hypothetical protein